EHLTDVITGDVERMELPFAPGEFNALIMSEVLEHLADPWHVLRRLKPHLAPGAMVLASSPNVSHRAVIWQLLRGRFDLEDSGVMDRTHLRWFTPSTYPKLFADCGYVVEETFPLKRLSTKQRIATALVPGTKHLHIKQICVQARKPQERIA
ncbi:MAG: methyltransferase domain-containing protein, partial [Pseudomonadota bacterium]